MKKRKEDVGSKSKSKKNPRSKMKIIYLSALPETMSGGPKYSVPNQVNAQALYDEVFWINITPWGVSNSIIRCECILELELIISRIKDISPDIVVFEDFYYISFCRIAQRLRKLLIPYIIVPRGSMTRKAQKLKWYKKVPANLAIFNRFAKGALAIEYLTEIERENSSIHWNKQYVIIPNGTQMPTLHAKPSFSKDKVRGIFIGRISLFHKGIDVFIEVCGELRLLLLQKNCVIDFYGPCGKDTKDKINQLIEYFNLDGIITFHPEIHNEHKEKALINSDFFVLTSRFEGLPMGLLEALSFGLPCLVTDETNIGNAIDQAGAGLSSAFDKELIKKNFEHMLKMNDEDVHRMSNSAVSFAKKYDWNSIAAVSHNEYCRLLQAR